MLSSFSRFVFYIKSFVKVLSNAVYFIIIFKCLDNPIRSSQLLSPQNA